jgi:hypothetical protein
MRRTVLLVPTVHNAVGVGIWNGGTRGSSFLATPGFGMESRWDRRACLRHLAEFHRVKMVRLNLNAEMRATTGTKKPEFQRGLGII